MNAEVIGGPYFAAPLLSSGLGGVAGRRHPAGSDVFLVVVFFPKRFWPNATDPFNLTQSSSLRHRVFVAVTRRRCLVTATSASAMSLPVAGLISVLVTPLYPSFRALQVSKLSWVSRQPRRRPSTASAVDALTAMWGFSGATMKLLEFCQEAPEIAHRLQSAEVRTTRWPEREPAFGCRSR
ncbi:hypothetical protein MRX96_039981 [Rhipicephalus microplus]